MLSRGSSQPVGFLSPETRCRRLFLRGVRPIGFQETVNLQVDKPISEPFRFTKNSLVAEPQSNANGATGPVFWRNADLDPVEVQVLETESNQGANGSSHIAVSGVSLC